MNVALCTPTGGWVRAPHYRAKAVLQAQRSSDRFTYAEVDLLIVSKARNELIHSLPEDCDVAWFVDSDVILPTNAGILLDYIQEYPIVSGLYHARSAPFLPQAYNRAAPGLANFAFLPVVDMPAQPFYADAVGAGCLLVQVPALRALEQAVASAKSEVAEWIAAQGEELPLEVQRAVERGNSLYPYFEFLESCGEDFYFCLQMAHYLGMRPFVIPEVDCAHETVSLITSQHYKAALASGAVNYSTDPASGILAS